MPLDTRSHLATAAAAICALGLSACAPGMEEMDPPADAETEEYGVSMSTTTIGGHPAWAHFTNPLAYADGYDHTILDEAIRLIDDTPSGATIRAAIHSLTVNGVASALIDAKTRGVMVQVVEDGSDEFEEDATPGKLAAALGAKHVYCGDGQKGGNYACITADPSGIMHIKLFTFSQTKDPSGALQSNVVWFGSANMTHATGGKTFNNTITI